MIYTRDRNTPFPHPSRVKSAAGASVCSNGGGGVVEEGGGELSQGLDKYVV